MSQELRINPGGKQPVAGPTREGHGTEAEKNSTEPMEEGSTLVSLLNYDLTLTLPTAFFFWQRMNWKE